MPAADQKPLSTKPTIIVQPIRLVDRAGVVIAQGTLPMAAQEWPLVILHEGNAYTVVEAHVAPAPIVYRLAPCWRADGLLQPPARSVQ